jgi:hypothetical protein
MPDPLIDAPFLDLARVRKGDLSRANEAERGCYEAGICAGLAAEFEQTWTSPLWRRLWWALRGGPSWPVATDFAVPTQEEEQ